MLMLLLVVVSLPSGRNVKYPTLTQQIRRVEMSIHYGMLLWLMVVLVVAGSAADSGCSSQPRNVKHLT